MLDARRPKVENQDPRPRRPRLAETSTCRGLARTASPGSSRAQTHVNPRRLRERRLDYAEAAGGRAWTTSNNTQFAVLGSARRPERRASPAPPVSWVRSLNHWNGDQKQGRQAGPTGATRAIPIRAAPASMTAAGLYCSLVAKATLEAEGSRAAGRRGSLQKRGWSNFKKNNPGLRLRASPGNPGHVASPYYDLYSLERAMMLSKTEKIRRPATGYPRRCGVHPSRTRGPEGSGSIRPIPALRCCFSRRAFVAVANGDNR